MNTSEMQASTPSQDHKLPTFEQWLNHAEQNMLYGILANISPADGKPGAVVASPSRSNPDYYYHWTRDSARTMGEVVRLAQTHAFGMSAKFEQMMKDYIEFSVLNQQTPNPSGHVGEPKFYVDGDAYEEEWGRPQNDGPAQRALTLTRWAHYCLSKGQTVDDLSLLYQANGGVIKTDLEFIAAHWQDCCFDVWEEVKGDHFYTRILQHVALCEGAELAAKLGDEAAQGRYVEQAEAIKAAMAEFWCEDAGYYLATLNRNGGLDYKTSGLDIAVLLGVFQSLSASASYLTATDDKVLATAYALYQTFDSLFAVNKTRHSSHSETLAPGIGRYPEDRYSGTDGVETGNPWFLCTGTMAGICYQAALLFSEKQALQVTRLNLPFLRLAMSYGESQCEINEGERYLMDSVGFRKVIHGLIGLGDAFLRRVQFHCGENDSMSEQFHYQSGEMLSAGNLTWSYVNILSCIGLKKQVSSLKDG
ncbi:glycoside hydrolase family 15 protein [Alteromonas confluentis]|uniref:glucan 1,4-alpha-glucosidase n=1 Tax=Alteromonas confluentis TaxID=1656094 RepID=A0A1E7Z5E7_9ALTE|nr:glycoside hydrolase family 15 protein [Alteromonas confluentis]OFC68773.1 hypothetical protein BFC18_00615 [Alteromonas confluentis]